MNDYDAAAAIGYVVRKMHVYEMDLPQAERLTKTFMADPVSAGVIMVRLEAAIRTNQEAIRHAQNRNAALMDLRDRISRNEKTA